MAEFRKAMKFGRSSLIVSLPKKWVEQNHVKKGDTINVDVINNSLVLSPKKLDYKPEKKEAVFEFDGTLPFHDALKKIKRKVITAYIYNYDVVTLSFKKPLEPKQMLEIRDLFHRLMAMEVIEQTNKKIVAKDFLDIEQIDIEKLIHKIDFILKTILSDYNFEKNSKTSLKEIAQRDYDINRLSFVITRAILNKMDKPGNNTNDLFRNLVLTIYLEKIGDELKRLPRIYHAGDFTASEKTIIKELFGEVKDLYIEGIKAYLRLDLDAIDEVIRKRTQVFNKIDSNFQKGRSKYWGMTIEKIRRIAELVFDVGKTIYNTTPLD